MTERQAWALLVGVGLGPWCLAGALVAMRMWGCL